MPHEYPTLIIGHEFLDALPIQKFQYTKKGWREVLIDLKDHVDWEVDDSLQNTAKGDDHASLSLEKAVMQGQSEDKVQEANGLEFKEILCPHNNLAATAMLGGLFEGETIEQTGSSNENGGRRALR